MCYMCHRDKEIRNINLYVIGSEGLNICHDCEIMIVKHIQELSRINHLTKIEVYKKLKEKQNDLYSIQP